ncbi:type II secretion system protein [Shewanella sp. S1-58-MNA-CIBAN-0166]|jgi:MSHA pilin protein MshA|uniref:type II secretion system protein n=1 Tax=Shewanella sp. S1-58-MNA-CIBAN-0166 TaxID=3140467 RepID=UPI00332E0D93
MQKQQGFTLIELVVVIIILGILAVTAAPKFINLQGDARVSALQGLKGAIQGANTLVYSKAALAGEEGKAKGAPSSVTLATGVTAITQYGYLQATAAQLALALDVKFDLAAAATTGTNDWILTESAGKAVIYQRGAPTTCTLTYTEATSAAVIPDYVVITDTSEC